MGVLPELSGGVLPELGGGALEDCGGVLLDGSGVLLCRTSAWVDAGGTWAGAAGGVLLDGTGAWVAAVPEVFSQATAGVLADGGAGAFSSAVGSRLSSISFRISASKSLRFSGLEKARDTST
jgi:hypothetical protein